MLKGLYIHIPYCLQRCSYCDFSTVLKDHPITPDIYVSLLKKEIQLKLPHFKTSSLTSIYFGGGTPSLLQAHQISDILSYIKSHIQLNKDCEITIEINPGTYKKRDYKALMKSGINRFSVGVQTFDDKKLKYVKRKHTSSDSQITLGLLQQLDVHFTCDILFGLPHQTLQHVFSDIQHILSYNPSHISAYCLTVDKSHFLNKLRPSESLEIKMYKLIWNILKDKGFKQYEISNYAKKGCESRHNLLYWTDKSYLGIGMSAHSYLQTAPWGIRFWNPPSLVKYKDFINNTNKLDSPYAHLPHKNIEHLKLHQKLTDFFHTRLRLMNGFSEDELLKFPSKYKKILTDRLNTLKSSYYLQHREGRWSLSERGKLTPNFVFQELTFLTEDLSKS